MAEVAAAVEAEDDAAIVEKTCLADVGKVRPAGRAVRGGDTGTTGPPGGSPDGERAAQDSEGTGAGKDAGCLGVEGEPPGEELPGRVELQPKEVEKRRS
jgi:hypothetical protein